MAKEEDTRIDDEELDDVEEETEEEEEESSDKDSDSSKGWQRLEETIDKVVGKRLSEWHPGENNSSKESSRETPKVRQSRKAPRKKGFLNNFFEGL